MPPSPAIAPADGPPLARRRLAPAGLLLAALALLAFFPALRGGFVWDDDDYVAENPLLRDPGGLVNIWTPAWAMENPAPDAHTPQYYPLVFTTFWIEYGLWGTNPLGYHLVNLALHVLAALLLWRTLALIGVPVWAGWAIATLFAMHPMQVESVAWITERKNVLSGALYFGSAIAYLHFARRALDPPGTDPPEGPKADARGGAAGWYGLSLLLFLLALFAKTVTATLPAALVILAVFQRRRWHARRILSLVPYVLLGLALGLNTAWYEVHVVGADGPEFERGFLERARIASTALWFYLGTAIAPIRLAFIYSKFDPNAATAWAALAGTIVVASASAFALLAPYARRFATAVPRPARAAAGWLSFFAVTLLPALGFANVYPHRFSFVADHFAYLALPGVIAPVVLGAAAVVRRSTPRRALLGAAIAVAVVLAFRHARIFRSEETLYRATIARNPAAWLARNNLGGILLRRALDAPEDDPARTPLLDEAIQQFRAAVEAKPDHHTAWFNLAVARRERGEVDAAYEAAVEAVETYRATYPGAPALADYTWYAGRLALTRGDLDAARRWFQATVEAAPRRFDAIAGLGDALQRSGAWREAANVRRRALDVADTAAEQLQAGYQAAWLLATAPEPEARDADLALALARGLVEVTDRNAPDALDALAAAMANLGRFDEAADVAAEAASLARSRGLAEMAAAIEARRAIYLDRRPFRLGSG